MLSFREIFKNTGLLGAVQVLNILLSIGRNKIAVLCIGSVGLGLTDLFAKLIEAVGGLTNFGIGLTAVRRISELRERGVSAVCLHRHVRLVRTWALLLALLGAAVTAMFALPLSWLMTDSPSHALSFACLAPAVAFSTLTFCEIAILRAFRCIGSLTKVGVAVAVSGLLVSAVCYVLLGIPGVLWAALGVTFVSWLLPFHFSRRLVPYRLGSLRLRHLRCGFPMLRLGFGYVVAGIVAGWAELFIRSVLLRSEGGWSMIAFYAAGITLTISYVRVLFTSLDADFFPRLSAVASSPREANATINRQIVTLVTLTAPFLLVFCACLPWIVPLLYSSEFLLIIPMTLCAAGAMYVKAIYTPVAYLSLARGDAFTYMVMEILYNLVFCAGVSLGYMYHGLLGAGLGLSAAHLFDLCALSLVYRLRYDWRMDRFTFLRCFLPGVCLALGLWCCTWEAWHLRFVGIALCVLLMLPTLLPVWKQIRNNR